MTAGLLVMVAVAASLSACGPRVRSVAESTSVSVATTENAVASVTDTQVTDEPNAADAGDDADQNAGGTASSPRSSNKKPSQSKGSGSSAEPLDIDAIDEELDAMQEELTGLAMPANNDFDAVDRAVY